MKNILATILGGFGSGKSAFGAKWLLEAKKKGYRVMADIHPKNDEWEFITGDDFARLITEEEIEQYAGCREFDAIDQESGLPIFKGTSLMEKFVNAGFLVIHKNEHVVILLDEIYELADARLSGSKTNIGIGDIILQSRHRNVDIIVIAQLASSIDKRIRNNTQVGVACKKYMKKVKGKHKIIGFRYWCSTEDKKIDVETYSFKWMKSHVLNHYDTTESVRRTYLSNEDAENMRIAMGLVDNRRTIEKRKAILRAIEVDQVKRAADAAGINIGVST